MNLFDKALLSICLLGIFTAIFWDVIFSHPGNDKLSTCPVGFGQSYSLKDYLLSEHDDEKNPALERANSLLLHDVKRVSKKEALKR